MRRSRHPKGLGGRLSKHDVFSQDLDPCSESRNRNRSYTTVFKLALQVPYGENSQASKKQCGYLLETIWKQFLSCSDSVTRGNQSRSSWAALAASREECEGRKQVLQSKNK